MRKRFLALTLATTVWAMPALASMSSHQTFLVGFHHEQGVESKMLATLLAELPVDRKVSISAGVSFSLFEHPGLSALELGARYQATGFWNLQLGGAVQHEQWNDWQIGENRVLALACAKPLKSVTLGAGIAWRAPVFTPDQYWLPFYWKSDAPELNLLYRFEWRFLDRKRFAAFAYVSNYDLLIVRNPQQFPFGLCGCFHVAPGWGLAARCASAINGLSTGLICMNEVTAEVGVQHGF